MAWTEQTNPGDEARDQDYDRDHHVKAECELGSCWWAAEEKTNAGYQSGCEKRAVHRHENPGEDFDVVGHGGSGIG
jgi:hypothetical protein